MVAFMLDCKEWSELPYRIVAKIHTCVVKESEIAKEDEISGCIITSESSYLSNYVSPNFLQTFLMNFDISFYNGVCVFCDSMCKRNCSSTCRSVYVQVP